jgi:serine/threonine-protein kinase
MAYFCPHCNHRIEDAPADGAAEIPCPECGKDFEVPETERSDFLKAGYELGGYEVIRPIGVGGMGQVYRATQLSLDREVALKILPRHFNSNREAMKRFLNEVRNTASLQHPNIVTVFESGEQDGICYLAMAMIEGESLEQMVERGRLDEEVALKACRGVAKGLDYAWRKYKLLHRDIKPANIMLDKAGNAKVLDLGIAKRPAAEAANQSAITRRGIAIGTPHYMSPEQARGQQDLDMRADIYSLGATLYHLVTGEQPYDDTSIVGILAMHINNPLPPPLSKNPELSPACAELVEIMMHKDRADRQRDWQGVIADIDRVLEGTSPAGKLPTMRAKAPDAKPAKVDVKSGGSHISVPAKKSSAPMVLVVILSLLAVALLGMNVMIERQRAAGGGEDPTLIDVVDPPPIDVVQPPSPSEPTKPSNTEVAAAVAAAADGGESPLDVADTYATEGFREAESEALWLILTETKGEDGEWALSAARRLLGKAGDDPLEIERILRKKIVLAEFGHTGEMHKTYIQLAEHLDARDRESLADRVLWDGLAANLGGDWSVSADLGTRLIDRYTERGDKGQLKLFVHNCLDVFPESTAFYSRARQLMDELEGKPDAGSDSTATTEPPPKTETEEEVERLLEKFAAEDDRFTAGRYLLKVADLLVKAESYDEAKKHLGKAVDEYGKEGSGYVGAHGLLKLAEAEKLSGNTTGYARTLQRLLEEKQYGPDRQMGVQATQQLAAYYKAKDNGLQRMDALKTLIEEFGTTNPDEAAAALFEMAAYYEERDKILLAAERLRRVQLDFRGDNSAHARRAKAEFERLAKKYPEALKELTGATDATGTDTGGGLIREAVRFNGMNEYIGVNERNTTLSMAKGLTLECWLRRDKHTRLEQYIMSRYGNNERGFNLFLDRNLLNWMVFDGKSHGLIRTRTEIPLNEWVHIAATCGNGTMELYVNGKKAATAKAPTIENDGAGRLKIGRRSWKDSGYFKGQMQNITVYPKVIYTADFEPALIPEHVRDAFILVNVRDKQVRDVKRNRIDYFRK